jgi:putative ABC transport system ATP-binding protein
VGPGRTPGRIDSGTRGAGVDGVEGCPQSPHGMVEVLEARSVYRFHEVEGRQVPILKDVTFRLEPGSFTTIMGPSGSGKSTLLHLLAGLDVPSAGDVLLAGHSLGSADEDTRTERRRQHIGFIFQFFNLLPELTVEENVSLPLRIAGEDPRRHRERIDGLVAQLGLEKIRDRVPGRLSGGEMQRVSIARALVMQPALLLCDEPTGNLSSKAGEETVALLRQAASQASATVLLVTHNPRDAAAGDRVLFLHDGELDPAWAMSGPGIRIHDIHARLEELGI